MSLHESVMEFAEDMEREADECAEVRIKVLLLAKAKVLRFLCKAAGTDSPTSSPQLASLLVPPSVQHAMEVEKYRSEFRKSGFRKAQQNVDTEELYEGDVVEVIGGPANPDNISTCQSIDPKMPVGAWTEIAGAVYQLRKIDGKRLLLYDEGKSVEIAKQRAQAKAGKDD